jgi:hypothetical protein
MSDQDIKAIMVRGPFTAAETERIIRFVKQIDDDRGDPKAVFEIMVLGGSGAKIDQLLRDAGEDTLTVRVGQA